MTQIVDLVVVTYHPVRNQLKKGLESLKDQVRNIIVVSNGKDNFEDLKVSHTHICLEENQGIGAAQNKGIQMALDLGADWILTADQDTIFPKHYVSNLLEVSDRLEEEGKRIGAIGPVFRDENHEGKIHSMVRFGRFGLRKFNGANRPEPVSHFISSGMLIPSGVFGQVGLMKEDFFMDWVDTEWCWRAGRLGFGLFQVPTITISHELGEQSRSYLGVSVTAHSQVREYYKIRNSILLLKDLNYISVPVWSYLGLFVTKSLLVNLIKGFRNKHYFRVVFSSLSDGVLGRSGKWSLKKSRND